MDTVTCLNKTLGSSQVLISHGQTGTSRVNTLKDTGGLKVAGKSNTGPSTAGSSILQLVIS